MRPIVAALLLLCSADAMAHATPPLRLPHCNQEVSLDRQASRWLRWRD